MLFIQKCFFVLRYFLLFFSLQTPFLFASWSTPIDLSAAGQNASVPQVAMNDSGQAVAVWVRDNVIQVATLTFGGSWSFPVDLSASDDTSTNPQIAINDNEQAVVVWRRERGSGCDVQVATLTFGENWSSAISLLALGGDVLSPQVAINALGQVIAVWSRSDGINYLVESASLVFGGSWSSVMTLSASGANSIDPQVVINGVGQIVAAWIRNDVVEADTCFFGGIWNGNVSLSIQPLVELLVVLLDSSGNAKISWRCHSLNYYIYRMATFMFGGSWVSPIFLTKSIATESSAKMLLNNEDSAVSYWVGYDGLNTRVRVASCCGNSGWSLTDDLSATGENVSEIDGVLNNLDQVVMIWSRYNGTHMIIQASTKLL